VGELPFKSDSAAGLCRPGGWTYLSKRGLQERSVLRAGWNIGEALPMFDGA
jgi:hypothetical protein